MLLFSTLKDHRNLINDSAIIFYQFWRKRSLKSVTVKTFPFICLSTNVPQPPRRRCNFPPSAVPPSTGIVSVTPDGVDRGIFLHSRLRFPEPSTYLLEIPIIYIYQRSQPSRTMMGTLSKVPRYEWTNFPHETFSDGYLLLYQYNLDRGMEKKI